MQHFYLSCMDSKVSRQAKPLTKEQFFHYIDSDYSLRTMRSIEKAPDQDAKNMYKGQLPVAMFCCFCPEDGVRPTLKTAVPSGLCIHDWDHMEGDVHEFYTDNIKGREEELGILLVHKTPRGSGLRLVTTMNEGETLPQCQQRFAEMFGMTDVADTSVKDITRLSFLPAREYFYYINYEKLFDGWANEVVPAVPANPTVPVIPANPVIPAVPEKTVSVDKSFPQSYSYEGITYDRIITELLHRIATNGKPKEGERNNDLYVLARELRHLTQYNFEITRMLVTPYFPELSDREIRNTINSAIASTGRTITPSLKGILAQLKSEDVTADDEDEGQREWPKMPQLPPVMDMVCKKFPKSIRPQVALAMLPILGAYGTHVRFRYCDNRVNSLSFQVAVVGKSGSGKAFAEHLYSMLTRKFEAMDLIERKKDQDYQDKLNKRKDKDPFPDDPRAKVRLFSDDITTSMMLEYLDNLDGEHGLQFTEEVARLTKAKKTHYGDNDDLYCKAFDNALGGKESKNRQTRNIRIKLYLNTLFCGTPQSMHKFYNNPEGGLNNRVIYANLPLSHNNGIPFYDDLTPEEEHQLDETLDMLYAAGTQPGEDEFKFPFLDKYAKSFIKSCDKEDDENPDDTWRDLANRATVMGYRAGALAYFLYGQPEDKKTINKITAFALWVAKTARISIYNFCGNEYDELNKRNEEQPKLRQTKNKQLFSLLPNEFTYKDVIRIRMQNGDSTNVKMIICRWVASGRIRKTENGMYVKLKSISA